MINKKAKGTTAERELIALFWNNGWAAFRAAGSGSMKMPCPDVIAGNNLRKLAIECKAIKDNNKYLTKKEVGELKTFSEMFGAEPWIGVRFDSKGWFFMNLEDLEETEKNFVVNIRNARRKGLTFEELTDRFG